MMLGIKQMGKEPTPFSGSGYRDQKHGRAGGYDMNRQSIAQVVEVTW